MILLELFSGTGSWGKIFKKHGFEVISIDIEEKFNPSIVADVLTLDYKKTLPVPDLILASPPCNSFSRLAVSSFQRDWYSLKPLTEASKLGEKLLYKTLEIIKYFISKNPSLLFVIENPKAMMRRMPIINKFPKETTLYCLYGFKWKKPTDFFNNFPKGLGLKDPEQECKVKTFNVANAPLIQRYMIPSGIVKQIYQAFKDQYKKDKPIKISFNKTQPDIIEKTGKGMMSKLFFVEPRAKEELKGGNLLNLRRFLNN
jgi:hypothetical protein